MPNNWRRFEVLLPLQFHDGCDNERRWPSAPALKKWVRNLGSIQLVWMEPKDGWLSPRQKSPSDPIRLVRMVKQIV